MSYLHNNNEMKAHKLLNKYSTGSGEPFSYHGSLLAGREKKKKNRVSCTSLPKIYKEKNNECKICSSWEKIMWFR